VPAYKGKAGRWRYRFSFGGKRYGGSTPKGANTKKTAEHLEREHIDKIKERRYAGEMPTLTQFAAQFLDYQKAHTGALTQKVQERALRKHTLPRFGSMKLDDFGAVHVDELVTAWRKGAAPRTCNQRLDTLGRMLAVAVEWELITKAPRIRKVRVPEDTPRFLTFDEAGKLLDSAPPDWRPMILIALRTGLRIGELRGLQWGDVDVRRRVIQVRRTNPGRNNLKSTSPKGKRERTIPLTEEAIEALEALRSAAVDTGSTDYIWPGKRSRSRMDPARPRSENACLKWIHAIANKAGIQGKGDDAIAWHTLRHTYASWLVLRGVSLRVVQDLLGHASIRQTERYSHLAPNVTHHNAVAALDFAIVTEAKSLALPTGCQPAVDDPPERP